MSNIISIAGDDTILDPVVEEFDRHKGTVTCIKSAPTKNLFVSCASDKEIRIYDYDQVCLQSNYKLLLIMFNFILTITNLK